MKNKLPCKDCKGTSCVGCGFEEERQIFDTSLLKDYIARMKEEQKIPFINQLLIEEGLAET